MQQVLQADNGEAAELPAREVCFYHSQSKLLMWSINFALSGLLQQVL